MVNAVFPCKEKLIKFVSFTEMMFQSMQSGTGYGMALGLGSFPYLWFIIISVQNLEPFWYHPGEWHDSRMSG